MNNKSIIMVTALVIFIVVGFYGIYEYYNGYTVNPQNNTSNQTNNQTTDSAINSDAVNNASEQDITVDATVDNASDATVTIIPANNVSPESIPNYTEENLSYDAQPINTSANTSMQIQSQPQAETTRTAVTSTTSVFNLDNMVAKAPQCNSSDPMDSATNSSLTNPTYDQLITFLESDTTDINALSDNQAVVSVAKAATNAGYHNQIVLIVFNNTQVFMVNRFPLADGNFAYIDDSKIAGFNYTGVDQMDRLLNVYKGQSITSRSPYNDNVQYIYPSTPVEYCIPFWKI